MDFDAQALARVAGSQLGSPRSDPARDERAQLGASGSREGPVCFVYSVARELPGGLRLVLSGIVRDMLQHRARILQIQKQESLIVGDFKDDRQNARLGFVEIEEAGQQQRAHFRDRRTNGMPLLAE